MYARENRTMLFIINQPWIFHLFLTNFYFSPFFFPFSRRRALVKMSNLIIRWDVFSVFVRFLILLIIKVFFKKFKIREKKKEEKKYKLESWMKILCFIHFTLHQKKNTMKAIFQCSLCGYILLFTLGKVFLDEKIKGLKTFNQVLLFIIHSSSFSVVLYFTQREK